MSDLPQWLEDYAQECRVLFGLEVWEIVVKFADAPGDSVNNEGFSTVNARYVTAQIELRRNLTDEQFHAVLMHEMLHVALGAIDQAFLRIRELVPKSLRKHAQAIHSDAVESTIERLVRALQREIKPSVKEETNA